ncbi:MAG: 30S ribosomal protein S8 [Victivallales bacterium]|nr:30S ribosomal protein S8 [Victivallales bacterium]
MSMQDPVADMITRIRNGCTAARRKDVVVPSSRMKTAIAEVLKSEGYIEDYRTEGEGVTKNLLIKLKFRDRKPVIEGIQRISKPSCRIYCGSGEIPKVRNGMGIVVVSTPKGIVSGKVASAEKVGGEILCRVW